MGVTSTDSKTPSIMNTEKKEFHSHHSQHQSSTKIKKNLLLKRNLREKRRPTGVEAIVDSDLSNLRRIWRQSAGESTLTGSEDEEVQQQDQQQHHHQNDLEDLEETLSLIRNTRFNEMVCTSSSTTLSTCDATSYSFSYSAKHERVESSDNMSRQLQFMKETDLPSGLNHMSEQNVQTKFQMKQLEDHLSNLEIQEEGMNTE